MFGEEPIGIKVELKTSDVSEALPQVLAANKFLKAPVVVPRFGLKAVPAALHVPVVGIKQTPWHVPFGLGLDPCQNRGGQLLQGLLHPLSFERHLR